MFKLQELDAEQYRRDTRRITLWLIGLFGASAMLLSALAVQLWGAPGADNFRYNLGGVLAGLLFTALAVRYGLWQRPWMAPAVYGWRLKRALMKVTNIMHKVEAGVAANDLEALKLLRFYHLGLQQMYRLDGNSSALAMQVREFDQHGARLQAQGIALEQTCLDEAWLASVRTRF